MKRILTLLLVLSLALAAFTSCEVIDKVKDMIGLGHEHSFVDGKCECGETDPDYVPTPEVDEGLQGAYDYIHQLYKAMGNTAGNYDLTNSVKVGDVNYTVTWSVDVESITITEKEDKSGYTVNIPNLVYGDPAISYKLTFVVANAAGDTLTRTYDLVVPEFKEFTYEQYVKAEKNTAVVVKGIVTGVAGKSIGDKDNTIFIQDAESKGGYYIYAPAADPAGVIEVGMTVLVKGDKDIYYGTHQIKNATIEIVDETIKTVEPIDLTEIFANAKNNSAEELVGKQGLLATVKGVTVKVAGSNGYYNWTLAGKDSYLRISSSTNCTTKAQEDTIIANFNEHFYYKADVTGIVTQYNGVFYLQPVSENAFANFVEQPVPDNEKVNYELGKLAVETITEDTTINISLVGGRFNDVVLSWESDNDCAVVDNEAGTLTITRGNAQQTVKLTVTATLGETTITKEITFTVEGMTFDGTANLTVDSMALPESQYTAGEAIVEGIKFGYTELANYGDGIQMRIKNGNTATLFNLTALPAGIVRIDLVYSANKSPYSNTGAFKFSFGNDGTVATYSVNLDTVEGLKTYSIFPDKETYTYFKMELLLTYSFYWDEINIVLANDPSAADHTHAYTIPATCVSPAKCECGKPNGDVDANAHDYAEATCTTPETCKLCKQAKEGSEPIAHTYSIAATCTAPAKCECGAEDPDNPALNHNYGADGKCQNDGCTAEQGVAQTKNYSYEFTEKTYSAFGTLALGDIEWTTAGDGNYWGYDSQNGKGQQFGSGGAPCKTLTLTSESFSNVSKIVINTSGASSINASFIVTVGGTQVGSATKLTTSATEYTFELDEPVSGPIVITYTQTSSKALYIKSIAVTYAE